MNKCLSWEDVKNNSNAIRIHNHGFVLLKDVYGNDSSIAEAARISYGDGTKSLNDNRSLIRYLVRNRHTSPIEQVCGTFIIKLPIFVMRQLVRHRTAKLNEYSGRYSIMPDEYYVPTSIRTQSESNKQGSDGIINDELSLRWLENYNQLLQDADTLYQSGIDMNMSRELNRICQPVSQYTICQWQMDLHNLMNFLRLRLDSHAQIEIREYAEAIYTLIKKYFPITIEAFEDYALDSITFSRMEIEALRLIFTRNYHNVYNNADEMKHCFDNMNMSNREISEFLKKVTKLCYE